MLVLLTGSSAICTASASGPAETRTTTIDVTAEVGRNALIASLDPDPRKWNEGERKSLLDMAWAAYQAGDYKRSWEYMLPLAILGDPSAQYAVAEMFRKGHGVERNGCAAMTWYDKSARHGYVPSMRFMAFMLAGAGYGYEENLTLAYRYLLRVKREVGQENMTEHPEVIGQFLSPEEQDRIRSEARTWDPTAQPPLEFYYVPKEIDPGSPDGRRTSWIYNRVSKLTLLPCAR